MEAGSTTWLSIPSFCRTRWIQNPSSPASWMTMIGKTCPVRARAFSWSWDKRARRAAMSPLGTECFDIFSPPPGAREVMTQVERLSSRDTKIALRSVRIAACSSGRGQRARMVTPEWVVQHPHSARERGPPSAPMGSLLGAIELWRSVQGDGPGRLAGDEEPPPVDGLIGCREEEFSQQIKADPEDRLSSAFVGLDDDRPVFRLPFTGRMGERKGHGQHGDKLADPVGVNEMGVLEIEAPRLGGRKKRFDLPPPPIVGQGDLRICVGGDHQEFPADQPRRSQFERRSKRAVA